MPKPANTTPQNTLLLVRNSLSCIIQELIQQNLSRQQLLIALSRRTINQQCYSGKCFLWIADVRDNGNGGYVWDKTFVDEGLAQLGVPLDVPPHSDYNHTFWCHWHTDDRARMGHRSTDYLRRNVTFYDQTFRCYNKHGEIQQIYEAVILHQLSPTSWLAIGFCQDVTSPFGPAFAQ